MPTTRRCVLGLGVILAYTVSTRSSFAESREVLVFAAASRKNALDQANARYTRETGKSARISYAASSTLAKQIENGAAADIFISADLDWMDYLAKRDLIVRGSRKNVLANDLVMIPPRDSSAQAKIAPGLPLAAVFPADTHPPIIYPIALIAWSSNADTPGYLSYLESAKGRPFFEEQGFKVPE